MCWPRADRASVSTRDTSTGPHVLGRVSRVEHNVCIPAHTGHQGPTLAPTSASNPWWLRNEHRSVRVLDGAPTRDHEHAVMHARSRDHVHNKHERAAVNTRPLARGTCPLSIRGSQGSVWPNNGLCGLFVPRPEHAGHPRRGPRRGRVPRHTGAASNRAVIRWSFCAGLRSGFHTRE